MVVSRMGYSPAMKMVATCSSETSVDFHHTTLSYITEDRTFYNHRCENLKSYKVMLIPAAGQNSLTPCRASVDIVKRLFQIMFKVQSYFQNLGYRFIAVFLETIMCE
jgi:hypothetical protein